jgi:hypothetical protein
LRLEVDPQLRCPRTGLESRVRDEMWGAMNGRDVCFELREESLAEVGFRKPFEKSLGKTSAIKAHARYTRPLKGYAISREPSGMLSTPRMPFGQIELVYLLVVELLGVYSCGRVDCVVFAESDEGEIGLEAIYPIIKSGYWDFSFMFALHGGLGLLQGVAEVEVC